MGLWANSQHVSGVISSQQPWVFFIFSLCFRDMPKTTNTILLCFSLLCVSPYFSFHFFSFFFSFFQTLKTVNIHMNMSCKLLSPPVLVHSTHFSLYAITEYRGSQSTHTLNTDFKTYTFVCGFSSIKFWRRCRGWERFDFTFLLTFLLCFFCAG